MTSLSEVRLKYPQYDDMSDDELARAMHSKFYSDMTFQEFSNRIGYRGDQQVNTTGKADREDFSLAEDVVRSGGAGLRSGTESMLGAVGDVQDVNEAGARWLAGKLGLGENAANMVGKGARYLTFPGMGSMQNTSKVRQMSDEAFGGDRHTPQSFFGEVARTAGEYLPATALGPGGVPRKLAAAGASALGTELAGRVARNVAPEYEPVARVGGALLGNYLATRGAGRSTVNKELQKLPSQEQTVARRNKAYQMLRDAGIKYDANEMGRYYGEATRRLTQQGFTRRNSPETWAIMDDIHQYIRSGKSPDFNTINNLSSDVGAIAGTFNAAKPRDKAAASILLGLVRRFEATAPMINTKGLSASTMNRMRRIARNEALKAIKGRELAPVQQKAENYLSGFQSGMKNQVKNILNSKRGSKLFSPDEQALLREVAGGSDFRKALEMVGRMGVGGRSGLANWNTLLPVGAGVTAGALSEGDISDRAMTAAVVFALASGSGRIARNISVQDMQRLLKVAQLGPEGQKRLADMLRNQKGRDMLAKILVAKLATTSSHPAMLGTPSGQ